MTSVRAFAFLNADGAISEQFVRLKSTTEQLGNISKKTKSFQLIIPIMVHDEILSKSSVDTSLQMASYNDPGSKLSIISSPVDLL